MTVSKGSEDLATQIARRQVPAGHVIAWWLGGSGFVFKTPAGTQIAIDPYLTNVVDAIFGQARAFPAPIRAEDARPDVLISTHWHEDHLDPEAIPLIARHSPATRFVMPPTAMARALSWGVPRARILPLSAGQTIAIADVTIAHVPARHEAGIPGWEVPDAMGVVLETGGPAIYHSGDTEYDVRLRLLRSRALPVSILCINGTGGNMNAHEAALLAWQLGSKVVIPMHHRLWAGNGGGDEATLDPTLFADTYQRLGGAGRVVLPEIGAPIDLSP